MVLVATLALSLGAAEAFLALVRPIEHMAPVHRDATPQWQLVHQPSAVPGLAYELRPNASGERNGGRFRINGQGRRGPEPIAAGPDTVRIAVVGDSFTFGFGVDDAESYPAVLEAELNAGAGPDYQVLNYGVGGYSSRDEALVVRHKVLPAEPDLVIVGYFFNDPEIDPIQPLQRSYRPVASWQRWNLARLLHAGLTNAARQRYGGGDYYKYLHRHPRKWASVERAFADIARACGAAGVPVALVIFPAPPLDGWPHYPYHELHAQVAATADAAGLEVLDLYEPFSRFAPESVRISEDDVHPTPLAHREAAQRLADLIGERLAGARDRRP